MTSNYDLWLLPPDPEFGTCWDCGHSEEDHFPECCLDWCLCPEYTDPDKDQEAEDARIRRAEEREGMN